MQGYMATLSAMEYECDKAMAEYKAFVEFCDTFEGDIIPDDLYTVAQEVYGADLAKSAGQAIVKLAKKIWEWIVKILVFVEDLVVKFFQSKWYKGSFERFKRLKEKLASDITTYDSRLLNTTKFVPDKQLFDMYQTNLSVLFNANRTLIETLLSNTPKNDLFDSLTMIGCPISSEIKQGLNGKPVIFRELYVDNHVTGDRSPFSKESFERLITDSMLYGTDRDKQAWSTRNLISAIDGVITLNAMSIKLPYRPLITKAKFAAKNLIDEVEAAGKSEDNTYSQESHDQLMVAHSLVNLVTKILQLEMQLAAVLSNIVERMGAYCISPGALNLKDADLDYKNANTSGGPFIAFNIGSVLSPFSK